MHIKITRTELLKAINITEKAIQSHVVIESLKGIKIKAEQGKVTFTAQKDDLAIEYVIEENLSVVTEGEIIVPSSYLGIIVKKTIEEEFEILNEENVIFLKTKKSKIKLTGYDISSYPVVNFNLDEMPITLSTDFFVNGFNKTKYSATEDAIKPILKGINFKFSNNVLTLGSSDAKRISIMKYNINSSNDLEFTLGKTIYSDLTKILEIIKTKTINIKSNGSQLLIEADQIVIRAKLLDGEYPNLERVIPTQNRFSFEVKTNDIQIVLEKILYLSSKEKGNVTINIDNDLLVLSSIFKDLGTIEEKVAIIGLQGSPFKISFDPRFLIEAIQALNCEEIYLQFVDEISGFIVKEKNGDNVLHVISPIRLS